jgi:hypothetical protein
MITSGGDDVSGRNPINFSPLHFLEEAAYKQTGLIITIVRDYVSKRKYAQA